MLLILLITEMVRTVMEMLYYPHLNIFVISQKTRKIRKKCENPKTEKTLTYPLCQIVLVV